MSNKLGPLRYASDQEEVFLGHSMSQSKNMSDKTADLVDIEVRRIVEDAYARATKILTDKADDLETLAQGLLEYELLSGDEIAAVLRGENILREDEVIDTSPKSSVPKGGGIDIE